MKTLSEIQSATTVRVARSGLQKRLRELERRDRWRDVKRALRRWWCAL